MAFTVFFSWQSDTPAPVGLDFIERALEQALARVADDAMVEKAIRDEGLKVDRDTKGVPGTPPIVDTIFRKIDRALLFVPDLTFVGTRRNGRPTPNPNVLVEYGYALKSVEHPRIVPVMNVAYGEPTSEAMPFDMRHLRWPLTYNLPEGADGDRKRLQHEQLVKELESAIRTFLESDHARVALPKPPPLPAFPAAEAKDGPARFRAPGKPLGIIDDRFLLRRPVKEIHLQDGPAVWLRLLPSEAPGRSWTSNELRKAYTEQGFHLVQLINRYSELSYIRDDDGFGVFPIFSDSSTTPAVTFAFNTGEVWSIDAGLLAVPGLRGGQQGKMGVPHFEPYFKIALSHFRTFLKLLGLLPPFRWVAGVEGIKGAGLYYPPPKGQMFIYPGPNGTSVVDFVSEQGVLEAETTPAEALKPFFVKLFDKCGLERPDYLDAIDSPQ